MLMHGHREAGQRAAPAHRCDLQTQILKGHRVVPVHGTLELQRESGPHLGCDAAQTRYPLAPLTAENDG
jgi:hypothetical protein